LPKIYHHFGLSFNSRIRLNSFRSRHLCRQFP